MKQDLTIPHGALDGIEAFLRVAERRSFSAAASDLGVSPSAISQTIKGLEARVGAPLFMRTTRSVGLTQAGEQFLARAAPAYAGLADAYEAARNLGNRPAGRLRINLMRGAIQPLFEPIIAGFCDAYPEIELEIYADDALSDLSAGGFDAGVRMGESLDADVIAVRLTNPFRFVAFGAQSYFERYGKPQHPGELRDHRCVRLRLASGGLMPWSFLDGNREVEIGVSRAGHRQRPVGDPDGGAQRHRAGHDRRTRADRASGARRAGNRDGRSRGIDRRAVRFIIPAANR